MKSWKYKYKLYNSRISKKTWYLGSIGECHWHVTVLEVTFIKTIKTDSERLGKSRWHSRIAHNFGVPAGKEEKGREQGMIQSLKMFQFGKRHKTLKSRKLCKCQTQIAPHQMHYNFNSWKIKWNKKDLDVGGRKIAACRETDESALLVDEVKETGNWFLRDKIREARKQPHNTRQRAGRTTESVSGRVTHHERKGHLMYFLRWRKSESFASKLHP